MNVFPLIAELLEKMSLLAAAALVAVLFPPLRARLLGLGQRRDKAVAAIFGLGLSAWGSMLGLEVLGENINVRAIGIFIAAILGGFKSGLLAGVGGGIFCALLIDEHAAPWVILASLLDGGVSGYIAKRYPRAFVGFRTFPTTLSIQFIHIGIVGIGLVATGDAAQYVPAWPAHIVKMVVNSAGATLFVVIARLMVAREEAAVALVEAKRAADVAALESLRRRLEPHFLFNALNTVRATIRTSPERARELVSDLADLYRYLLSHPDDASLREEVNHACAYLAVERARVGEERLRVITEIPAELEAARIPALLLQPLVENAVKHGIARHTGRGTVTIRARADVGELAIDVHNTSEGDELPPLDEGAGDEGSGIALETLRERLGLRFGEHAKLTLSVESHGATASVCVPLEILTSKPKRSAA
ncbi:MAG: histidine kinase [Polyangiales bacterium]|nr:histidine kinase [Myxococcales bacterium]